MNKLDTRRMRSQGKRGQFREKRRVLGSPSTLPRQSSPDLAIREEEESAHDSSEEEMESRESPLNEEVFRHLAIKY